MPGSRVLSRGVPLQDKFLVTPVGRYYRYFRGLRPHKNLIGAHYIILLHRFICSLLPLFYLVIIWHRKFWHDVPLCRESSIRSST